jgi:hypothetical protein
MVMGAFGPFIKVWIVSAGTAFKHAKRWLPGDCVHPTAAANSVHAISSVSGVASLRKAEDKRIAPANGGFTGWRCRNHVTLEAPADCPIMKI